MSSPSRRTSPASFAPDTDSCIRFKMRRKVDLPQPEGPMRAVTEAGGTNNETSSRTAAPGSITASSTAMGFLYSSDPDDGLVERLAALGPEEAGVAEVEDPT